MPTPSSLGNQWRTLPASAYVHSLHEAYVSHSSAINDEGLLAIAKRLPHFTRNEGKKFVFQVSRGECAIHLPNVTLGSSGKIVDSPAHVSVLGEPPMTEINVLVIMFKNALPHHNSR